MSIEGQIWPQDLEFDTCVLRRKRPEQSNFKGADFFQDWDQLYSISSTILLGTPFLQFGHSPQNERQLFDLAPLCDSIFKEAREAADCMSTFMLHSVQMLNYQQQLPQ